MAIACGALWCVSALTLHPQHLVQEIDAHRINVSRHPTLVDRSIVFLPGLAWVDWREGSGIFDCAGYHGPFVITPLGTKVLWKRLSWIP